MKGILSLAPPKEVTMKKQINDSQEGSSNYKT